MLFFVTFIIILKLYLHQEKLSPYFNLIFIQIHVFYFSFKIKYGIALNQGNSMHYNLSLVWNPPILYP